MLIISPSLNDLLLESTGAFSRKILRSICDLKYIVFLSKLCFIETLSGNLIPDVLQCSYRLTINTKVWRYRVQSTVSSVHIEYDSLRFGEHYPSSKQLTSSAKFLQKLLMLTLTRFLQNLRISAKKLQKLHKFYKTLTKFASSDCVFSRRFS